MSTSDRERVTDFEVLAHTVETVGLSASCEAFDVDREAAEEDVIAALRRGDALRAQVARLRATLAHILAESVALGYDAGNSRIEALVRTALAATAEDTQEWLRQRDAKARLEGAREFTAEVKRMRANYHQAHQTWCDDCEQKALAALESQQEGGR